MATNHQIERAARDRMIDLLGLGVTYPLTDLGIKDEGLSIVFGDSADISIINSQVDVVYQLYDYERKPVKSGNETFKAEGTGTDAELTTPRNFVNFTYTVCARKFLSPQSEADNSCTFLKENAAVKVGLNKSLDAYIGINPPDIELLGTSTGVRNHEFPRIIDYDSTINVTIKNTQKNVRYRLTQNNGQEDAYLSEEKPGKSGENQITIISNPLIEDTIIRIEAKRYYESGDEDDDETVLLNARLPLKVRANPDQSLTFDPATNIVRSDKKAFVFIEESQPTVQYRVFSHPVDDYRVDKQAGHEFIYDSNPPESTLSVDVEGFPSVIASNPVTGVRWGRHHNNTYSAMSSVVRGTGGKVEVPINALIDDSVLLVQATKVHDSDQGEFSSAIKLNQALLVLVKPKEDVPLEFTLLSESDESGQALVVEKGQPSVFYHFSLNEGGAEVSLPAYFHVLKPISGQGDLGVDRLRIGGDFVVANDQSLNSPLIDLEPFPNDAQLHILARKSKTNVTQKLSQIVNVPQWSLIESKEVKVNGETNVEVTIKNSIVEAEYQLLLNGDKESVVKNGNGGKLIFIRKKTSVESEYNILTTHHLPGDMTFILKQSVDVKESSGT